VSKRSGLLIFLIVGAAIFALVALVIVAGAAAYLVMRPHASSEDAPPARVQRIIDARHAETETLAREMRTRCATLGEQPLAGRQLHLFAPRPALADDPDVANIGVTCVIEQAPTLESRMGYRLDPSMHGHDSTSVWYRRDEDQGNVVPHWTDHASYPSMLTEDDAVDVCVMLGSYEEVGSVLVCVAWRG
jgi:hypothetical protein